MRSLILTLCLLVGPAALAESIYRWIDENGIVNYTNDKSKVPAGVKAEATTGDEIVVVASPRLATAASSGELPATSSTDLLSPEERARADYWRSAFRDVHARIARLQLAVSMDKQRLQAEGAPYRSVRGRSYRASLASGDLDLQQRLEWNQAELRRATSELDELERIASREAVPREWRQP